MTTFFVNNVAITTKTSNTLFQALTENSFYKIPRFCFHKSLLVAGNCRICLVEVANAPKPVASCAIPVQEGIKVFTESPLVKKAQEGVLEFLLVNHPLDCPVCDQGGECDLQEHSFHFGNSFNRNFYHSRRVSSNKAFGPLVKTVINRCIHCTRCVRFLGQIAGFNKLGLSSRGYNSEITIYREQILISNLSGNVIDLCPVGYFCGVSSSLLKVQFLAYLFLLHFLWLFC